MIHFSAKKLNALFDSDIISLDGSSSEQQQQEYYSSSVPHQVAQPVSFSHDVENNSFEEQRSLTKSHLCPITTSRAAAVSLSPGQVLDSSALPFRSLKEGSFKDRYYSSLCGHKSPTSQQHESPNPQQKKEESQSPLF